MISLNPKTFVSGGLLNDVDVEVVEARYSLFDYQGTVDAANMRTALKLTLRTLDGTQDAVEYLTLGSTADFVPNDDDGGLTLKSLSGKTALSRKSKLYFFLQSLADAGADTTRLDSGRADELEGLRIHVVRKPLPQMSGLEITRARGDNQNPVEYLHVTKLISWEPRRTSDGQAAAAQTPQQDAAEELACQILISVAKPGMTPKRLAMEAMKSKVRMDPSLRNQVSRLLTNDQWLAEHGVLLENGQITDILIEDEPYQEAF